MHFYFLEFVLSCCLSHFCVIHFIILVLSSFILIALCLYKRKNIIYTHF